jgi:hypothetical protein
MRREISEEEFLNFAHSYLSEAFPNPQRIGCICDWDLIEMAERPNEAKHAAVSEHLTYCSTSQLWCAPCILIVPSIKLAMLSFSFGNS